MLAPGSKFDCAIRTGVMRLHALQRMDENSSPVEVDFSRRRDHLALDLAPRPERVPHLSPWSSGIRPESACTILTHNETRSDACDLEVDGILGVGHRLDCVGVAVFGQLDGDVVGIEAMFRVVEAVVLQRI